VYGIAWKGVPEMTYTVSSGTLNATHLLTQCEIACMLLISIHAECWSLGVSWWVRRVPCIGLENTASTGSRSRCSKVLLLVVLSVAVAITMTITTAITTTVTAAAITTMSAIVFQLHISQLNFRSVPNDRIEVQFS